MYWKEGGGLDGIKGDESEGLRALAELRERIEDPGKQAQLHRLAAQHARSGASWKK